MKRAALLSIPLAALLGACSQDTKRDSVRLDLILATQQIDIVEFVTPTKTNRLSGDDARKLVASLHITNRIAHTDWTKQQLETVRLLNGMNEACSLFRGEDGSWEFGTYGFQLRPH